MWLEPKVARTHPEDAEMSDSASLVVRRSSPRKQLELTDDETRLARLELAKEETATIVARFSANPKPRDMCAFFKELTSKQVGSQQVYLSGGQLLWPVPHYGTVRSISLVLE